MTAPHAETELKIKSLGSSKSYLNKAISKVSLLGYKGKLKWRQQGDGLIINYPSNVNYATSVVFKIN